MFSARTGFFAPSSTSALPAGQAVLSSTINYAYQQYSQSSVSYVGPDSSSRPVFFFAYADSSNLLRAQLWRINDDGTITQGTEQSAGSASCLHSVQSMSEYEGANSFGTGSGSYVYMGYTKADNTEAYGQVASVDQDALTCTFGTAVVLSGTPDADQTVAAYVGNSSAVFGCRTGGGMTIQRYTRSGTSLTAAGTLSSDLGYRIDAAQLGFDDASSVQFRSAFFDTANGASGTVFGASYLGSTNYSAYDNTLITTSSQNFGCNLNATDKMLGTYRISSTVSAIAVPITWNASSDPTFAPGTGVTAVTPTGSGGSWYPASGFTTNTAYILYNDTGTTISYVPVTISGTTTVTVGSSVQMFTGLSNFYYQMMSTSAVIGAKTYLCGVQIRSTATPYIYGYRLS